MRLTRRQKPIPPSAAIPARNPLAAIPLIPGDIDHGADNLGLIQLRRRIQPKGSLTRRISRMVGFKYSARLNLDACGSFYWRQVDGTKNLDNIADAFATHFKCSTEEARTAVLKFTRTLLLRNMILLQIENYQPGH